MANYILLNRDRARQRARARPNAPGNFVTASMFAQWYSITFPKSEKDFIHSILAKPVFSKAIGYYDNPPPKWPWVPLASSGNPQQAAYPSQHIEPPRPSTPGAPGNPAPVITIGGRPGMAGVFVPGTNPRQINRTTLVIKRITVLADPANANSIWTGYTNTIQPDLVFPLTPGAARDYDMDDLSELWLVAENATDQVFYIYELP